jgi:hypothetical protein
MNQTFEIKITGSGTRDHLFHSINDLMIYMQKHEIFEESHIAPFFEDPIICVELKEL